MNRREMKRRALWSAYLLLVSGPPPSPGGFIRDFESGCDMDDLTDTDFNRWCSVWDELLEELRRRGHIREREAKGKQKSAD